MNKLIGFFTGVALGGLVAQAKAADKPDLKTTNTNVIVETLLQKVAAHNNMMRPLPYKKLSDLSFVCSGNVPVEIDVKNEKGKDAFYGKPVPEIVRFANDPNARDKNGQKKIKDIIETRKDLAYVEFTTGIGAPNAKDIKAYLGDVLKVTPIDLFQGALMTPNGGSVRSMTHTTLLMEQKDLDKFIIDNASDIRKTEEKMVAAEKGSAHYTYSDCGPKAP